MARCPFARWMPLPWNAGRYVAGPFKIVHHTTEGSTAAGAFATYHQTQDIPHFTVDDQFIYQHLDTEVAATALAHPPGTVETNKHSAVQFELVGFAGRPKNRASLKNVGRLCRWIESTHGVPPEWPNGYPKPPVNSITASDGLELVEEKSMLPAMSSRASTPKTKRTDPVRKAGAAITKKPKKAKAKKAGKKRT